MSVLNFKKKKVRLFSHTDGKDVGMRKKKCDSNLALKKVDFSLSQMYFIANIFKV